MRRRQDRASAGARALVPETAVLPAGLAYQLVHTLQLTNEEIAALTIEEAVQRMAEFWAQPPPVIGGRKSPDQRRSRLGW